MATDQAVLRRLDHEEHTSPTEYAAALLHLSRDPRVPSAVPLAFGEEDAKERIVSLLRYRRPVMGVLVAAALVCLVLAYPLAYIMARAEPKVQKTFMTIIMIPMWMNFLIRTYAWMTILQDKGIFNNILSALHLPGVHIIGTEAAVVIGMVYDYIPYMILPLFSIMAKMDVKLIEAARDLGCNGLGVLRRVIWPLSLPGVISGVTMVLIPSVSTFYISQKLGDGKIMLIGDVIEGQYVANNLHFAAAIAFVLMVLLLVCMAVMRKLVGRNVEGGL